MRHKLLAALLATVLLFTIFTGCTQDPAQPNEGTSFSTTQATPAATTAPPPLPTEHDLNSETYLEYTLIYPSAAEHAKQAEAAKAFGNSLSARLGTEKLTMQSDETTTSGKEIIIGQANRQGMDELLAGRHKDDGLIVCEVDRIIITGTTDEGVARAIERFWEFYFAGETETTTLFVGLYDAVSDYALSNDLKINGVPLSEYCLIIPEDCDLVTYYTAYQMVQYFHKNANVFLKGCFEDSVAEREYEILIGATNRVESQNAASITLGSNEYLLYTDGTKIILQGSGFYVGSAVYELLENHFPDNGSGKPINATSIPSSPQPKSFTFPKATSAIMIIGDGMGKNVVSAAIAAGKIDRFYAREFPYVTECMTYSQSVIDGTATYTDSAASATALATGYKTINGYIGKDANGYNVMNISEYAYSKGANVAVLTTDPLYGATPSGFNVHNISRNNSTELQAEFDEKLADGRLMYAKGKYQGIAGNLAQATLDALFQISANDSRFFIMIEEANTDICSHANNLEGATDAVASINEAVACAVAFVMTHPETALLVTADHETGGLTDYGDGNFGYTTTGHTNVNVPYYAFGGEDVKEFVTVSRTLNNVWNAMFLASIYGDDPFGDPRFDYKPLLK